ncbi:MAG TPA: hypothetical protein VI320_00920 [Terracidiphilus sp.]
MALLLRKNIATLDELTLALVTSVTVTVFRKPKTLDYLTSYSHRGRYYTLREISEFDVPGLCSHAGIHFSRFGTLLATAEALGNRSPRGHSAEEMARALNVEVQDALHQLTEQRRVSRQVISGKYLYTAVDRARQQAQPGARRSVEALPALVGAARLEIPVAELKAAILLFYSLLDEQQRRLYAGLDALRLRAGRRSPACRILRPRFPYCGPRTS